MAKKKILRDPLQRRRVKTVHTTERVMRDLERGWYERGKRDAQEEIRVALLTALGLDPFPSRSND